MDTPAEPAPADVAQPADTDVSQPADTAGDLSAAGVSAMQGVEAAPTAVEATPPDTPPPAQSDLPIDPSQRGIVAPTQAEKRDSGVNAEGEGRENNPALPTIETGGEGEPTEPSRGKEYEPGGLKYDPSRSGIEG